MAVLHSVLALYGAFDQVAVQTRDPEMRAMVEKLLPGTTGDDQRGWFKEIQAFVRRNATNEAAAEFPSPQEAMQELTGAQGFEGVPTQMSSRDVGRLFQATMGLGLLKASQPAQSTPIPVLEQVDMEMFDTVCAMAASLEGLGTSAEPPAPLPGPPPTGITSSQLPQMLDVFREQGLDGWRPFIEAAVEANQVARDVAVIPPITAIGETLGPEVKLQIPDQNGVPQEVTDQGKVTSEVIEVNGILAVLLTTEFTRTPWDINRVTGIIDPLNWDNANKFFAEMTPTGPTADGRASQVLEEVSTDPGLYRIKTHLKYVKEERPDNNFVINYDFADRRGDDDSRQVHVDSGYIVLSPTADGTGVRVLTSKMVAMDGLSPTAVAIFAHAMGWLSIGEMMMFGDPTNDPTDPIVSWTTEPNDAVILTSSRHSAQNSAAEEQSSSPQPVSQIFVKETTKAVAEYVNVATEETAVIADKWFKGDLSVQDMINHTTKLGGKLFSEPFRILDTLMKNAAGRASDDPRRETVRDD